MNFEDAVKFIAESLKRDAELQEQARTDRIGEDFDYFDTEAPGEFSQLMIALNFWDAWIDERNHGFAGHYEGFERDDWPRMARKIADEISGHKSISDPRVLFHFDLRSRAAKDSLRRRFVRWMQSHWLLYAHW